MHPRADLFLSAAAAQCVNTAVACTYTLFSFISKAVMIQNVITLF
jgi:hypothetical protein